ncbi:MAG TPA: hypothetical protein PKC72_09255 [Chitinophagaceae bacterium]|nr:hypothetical protein [Chitinophagaceae bacterium]
MTGDYIYFPEQLSGKELDVLLAKGWYRMGQSIFTTHYLLKEDGIFRVFWLRYNLKKIKISKSSQRIININKRFRTSFQPMKLSDELEELYKIYKSSIDFDPAASVQQWLYGEQTTDVYDSCLIEVRDNDLLIAAGIFDKGQKSIAGIMNFFHPEYKKYSLGKYLMLIKTAYAIESGMRWYYPGYLIYGYPKFNYKLFIDKENAEIYIPEENSWSIYNAEKLDEIMKDFLSRQSGDDKEDNSTQQ